MADVTFVEQGRIAVQASPGSLPYRVAKRTMDLVVASACMVLLLPVLLAIAVAIRFDSPGRAIFTQERVRGRRLKRGQAPDAWEIIPFTLVKFRTMEANADDALHREYMKAYLEGDEAHLAALRPGRKEGEHFRPAHDPRVTRVGAFLRKMSLDELPQLWNVLKGDMSLVGPRPPMAYEVASYQERHLSRLAARPGLTGLAQVRGRAALGFEDTVALDVRYMRQRSLMLDVKILLWTIPTVLSRKGAG